MIGWNFEPDFVGDELDERIKKKIDSIPNDLFYPKYENKEKKNQIVSFEELKKNENFFENFLKEISSPNEIEMKNFLNSIEFPEKKLFKNLKIREEITLKRELEKEKEKKKKKKKKNFEKIEKNLKNEISISLPIFNENVKTSEETLKILREFEILKKNFNKKMNFELNESKLKILLNLEKKFNTQEQKNDWLKYLNENYIKKYENEKFSKFKLKNEEKNLKNLKKNEEFLTNKKKFQFQFQNSILKNEEINFKKFLKSKL